MKYVLIISFFVHLTTVCQTSNSDDSSFSYGYGPLCYSYEKLPEVVGGLESIQSRLTYPELAKNLRIEGKVYILVSLDSLGNLESAVVIKGLGFDFDEEALRVVRSSIFTPGYTRQLINPGIPGDRTYRLRPVKSMLTIPVTFKLQ
jgi:periplasmic protein TonB